MEKKKLIVLITIIILIAVIFVIILLLNGNKIKHYTLQEQEEELKKIASEIETEHSIVIIESSGEKHVSYNLDILKEVYGKNIDKFSNCNTADSYVTIYPDRQDNRYEVDLNCTD